MTAEMLGMDEFDGLLGDVLRSVANPEMPGRLRERIRARVWASAEVGDGIPMSQMRDMGHPSAGRPAIVFAPEVFLARMAPRRDARSTMMAVLVHAAAIGLLFWVVALKSGFIAPNKTAALTQLTVPPPVTPLTAKAMGGGGGQVGATPVAKGALPKFVDQQITPPKAPPMVEPKIKMPNASIEVQRDLKMTNNNMPNLGMPNSSVVGNSMGNGHGTGLGSGNGSGLGSGSGANYGGGVRQVGGGVSAPVLMYSVEPEFSEEARKAKTSGNVLVNLIVDEHGNPQRVRVLRGVGMGLDEKAVAAVEKYKFKPAMEGGKAVTVELNVEVNFQIF